MLNCLIIPLKNQDTLNNASMFHIRLTPQEKEQFGIQKPDPVDIWFYRELERNKKEYLDVLANKITSLHFKNKQSICKYLESRILFETT